MYRVLIIATLGFSVLAGNSGNYQSDLAYNTTYTFSVNNTEQCILQFSDTLRKEPPRVTIRSVNAVLTEPVQVLVRQSREQLTWQLPLVLENDSGPDIVYDSTSRILCHRYKKAVSLPHDDNTTRYNYPVIIVGTASHKDVDFTVEVEYEMDFFLEPNVEKNLTISPNNPLYYFYNFTDGKSKSNHTSDNYDTVILEITSDDAICMTVSIQNASCPAFDNEEDATYRGFYQTINHKGGFTIPKSKFPLGFHAVFAVKFDDEDCIHVNDDWSQKALIDVYRQKSVTIVVKPTLTYSDYVTVVVITVVCVVAFWIIVTVAYWVILRYDKAKEPMSHRQCERTLLITQPDNTDVSRVEYAPIDGESKEAPVAESISEFTDVPDNPRNNQTSNTCLYLYSALMVGTFYALPAIQLVVENQILLNQSGQQDMCYYNFLCVHSVGYLSDFNHLFSNIGYVCLGLLFVLITKLKARRYPKDAGFDEEPKENDLTSDVTQYGIPQHYEMFYAMGVSLAVEGVMSGAYHVCPKETNFQFDASFMYVTVMLCLVKLYQSRNHNANAPAHVTFIVLAVAVSLGMLRVLHHHFVFWILFAISYLLGCVCLGIKVYYKNDWKFDWPNLKEKFQTIRSDRGIRHPSRMALIIVANLASWILVIIALKLRFDFSLFLLGLLITNTLIYFFYYLIMKLYLYFCEHKHGERVRILTWIFLAMAVICGGAALWCFNNTSIAWSKTPAESRYLNQPCKLWKFYDYHDIWHFLSATAMFFLFMCFLTLDDNLSHTPRSEISQYSDHLF